MMRFSAKIVKYFKTILWGEGGGGPYFTDIPGEENCKWRCLAADEMS